jgi:hypothetical protein
MTFRFKGWYVAPLAAILMALVMLTGVKTAHATTYNTWKPIGTNYCVADENGGLNGYVSLVSGCGVGTAQAWATSSQGGGYEIYNEATGLCIGTDGAGVKLYMSTCNGSKAQTWDYIEVTSTERSWYSPYTAPDGNNYAADANATYGLRAEEENGTNAQIFNGPGDW